MPKQERGPFPMPSQGDLLTRGLSPTYNFGILEAMERIISRMMIPGWNRCT